MSELDCKKEGEELDNRVRTSITSNIIHSGQKIDWTKQYPITTDKEAMLAVMASYYHLLAGKSSQFNYNRFVSVLQLIPNSNSIYQYTNPMCELKSTDFEKLQAIIKKHGVRFLDDSEIRGYKFDKKKDHWSIAHKVFEILKKTKDVATLTKKPESLGLIANYLCLYPHELLKAIELEKKP